MTDYSRQGKTALKLIEKSGKPVTLQREIEGGYDPSTGGSTTTTETASGYGVFVRYSNQEIDGTTILSSDKKMLYVGEEPKAGDKYGLWRVVNPNPIDPDESGAIMYQCQLRK